MLAAAGLKNTVSADMPKAAAYATPRCSELKARASAMAARPRSAATMTRRRGKRSATVPARKPRARTGTISKAMVTPTFSPDPVSR